MSDSSALGLMGGCFDPVHKGHIALAGRLAAAAELSEVRFVISGSPPHRPPPAAPASLRRRMLAAAIAGIPHFVIEDCELQASGPCFTADTLALLRGRYPARPLCWMMGFDSFVTLPQWRRWKTLFEFAHFLVGGRSSSDARPPAALEEQIRARRAATAAELRTARSGRIMICPQPVMDVSATGIREAARSGTLESNLIPDPVARIIRESGAYPIRQVAHE